MINCSWKVHPFCLTGFPLNDFCLNYEIMGFLEIGGTPINRLPWCVKTKFLTHVQINVLQ